MEQLLHRHAHGPELESVTAKLTRSWDHFDSLEDMVLAWMKSGQYRLTRETNADFTEHRLLYQCPKELNFKALALIFGDAIHNLRSALDHLIYSIAIHKSSQPRPPDWDRIAFPITNSPEKVAGIYTTSSAASNSWRPRNTRRQRYVERFLGYRDQSSFLDKICHAKRYGHSISSTAGRE